MKALYAVLAASLLLVGCSGTTVNRESCATELNAAWKELDLAKAEGFAGTVSYSKAFTLITAAKTEQQVESYGGCLDKASKARYYIKESRAGR
ncbi:hypothetical protein LNN38_14765 [Pseudomonas sp. LA21]|uniref:hypothetical protein n=1 Tax=unclassified Pseudomonas TaxID=196821 RepID=UPI001A9F1877|nr:MULTISPECIES: hypothetical protein [unclassified Pseudomonas]MCJ1886114.1 hypothetical protein [Pseudomonas sp. LA21]